MAQGAGNAPVFASVGARSQSTHLTVSPAPCQAQSFKESLAQSIVQMPQALVASAAQTQAMLGQGVGRLPVLKLDGRGRPKVKDVKKWIKDIGDKRLDSHHTLSLSRRIDPRSWLGEIVKTALLLIG